MENDLLRIVEAIHRERNIDKEIVFLGIESAIATAVRKHYGESEEVMVHIDRETGRIQATENDRPITPEDLGRIAAQTAKQVIIQKIREAECDVLYDEYVKLVGQLVNGTIQRFEGPNIIVNMGKTEGFLPASEQMPGENYRTGDRIRAIVIEVRKTGPRLRVVLSRRHPDLIRRLFGLEVPEINERIIDIKGIAREAGYRTKIAVSSIDPRVDCVGACVGVRGTRIKNIVDELNGEKIDIVRYNEFTEVMIMNCLKPAEIDSLVLEENPEGGMRASVAVREDQLALAIGKKGRNVRLAAELAGCSIDIVALPSTGPSEERKATGGGQKGEAEPEGPLDDIDEITFLTPAEIGAIKGAGFKSKFAITLAGRGRIAAIEGIGEETTARIFAAIESAEKAAEAEREQTAPDEDAVTDETEAPTEEDAKTGEN